MFNNFFCEMCSLQFDKSIMYDIHMSFVHKKEQTKSIEVEALIREKNEDLVQDINLQINEINRQVCTLHPPRSCDVVVDGAWQF